MTGWPPWATTLASTHEPLSIAVRWQTIRPTADPAITQSSPSDQVPDGEVNSSLALRADTIEVTVLEDGSTCDPDRSGLPHVFSAGESCIVDRAAAWG